MKSLKYCFLCFLIINHVSLILFIILIFLTNSVKYNFSMKNQKYCFLNFVFLDYHYYQHKNFMRDSIILIIFVFPI